MKRAGNGAHRISRSLSFLLILAALATFAAPAVVRAEQVDRDKPIQLEADRVTVDDVKQVSVFTGNVVLTQGSMVIRGDRLEVRQDKEGFRHGTTWGNLAYIRQKREGMDEFIEGWAERIEYDSRADKVQMFNRAIMKRGEDEVRGTYIAYDVTTEFFQVNGGPAKPAVGATPGSGDGRVRAVINPKQKDKPASGAPMVLRSEDRVVPKREEPPNVGR